MRIKLIILFFSSILFISCDAGYRSFFWHNKKELNGFIERYKNKTESIFLTREKASDLSCSYTPYYKLNIYSKEFKITTSDLNDSLSNFRFSEIFAGKITFDDIKYMCEFMTKNNFDMIKIFEFGELVFFIDSSDQGLMYKSFKPDKEIYDPTKIHIEDDWYMVLDY